MHDLKAQTHTIGSRTFFLSSIYSQTSTSLKTLDHERGLTCWQCRVHK